MILPKLEKDFGNIGKSCKSGYYWGQSDGSCLRRKTFAKPTVSYWKLCQHFYHFPNFILLCRHLSPLPQRYQTV